MVETLTAQVTGPYSSGVDDRLFLEAHVPFDDDGILQVQYSNLAYPKVLIALYPNVNAELVASIGSIISLGGRVDPVRKEVLEFAGEAEKAPQYPVASTFGTTFETIGRTFDEDGNPINVSFIMTSGGMVRASKPFYGVVLVNYTKQYKLLEYSYEVRGRSGGGSRIEGGTIMAFYQGKVAQFTPPPPELPPETNDLQEKYRIISKAIVQKEQAYEYPVGWTGNPGSPTHPGGDPDPTKAWVVEERVHEIGYVDEWDRTIIRTYSVRIYEPYQTDDQYEPVLETVLAPGFTEI